MSMCSDGNYNNANPFRNGQGRDQSVASAIQLVRVLHQLLLAVFPYKQFRCFLSVVVVNTYGLGKYGCIYILLLIFSAVVVVKMQARRKNGPCTCGQVETRSTDN